MLLNTVAAVAALAAAVAAAPAVIEARHVLHERREYEAGDWQWTRPVPQEMKLPVRIGMTQSNMDRAHDLLMEISEHDSPKYGQHYTAEEVIELFAPSAEAVEAVRAWLHSAGVEHASLSANKQWMQFDTPAHQLESLLKTKFHEYEHVATGSKSIACDKYFVPEHIQEHIDYITPGVKMMTTRKAHVDKAKRSNSKLIKTGPIKSPLPPGVSVKTKSSNPLAECGAIITPACVQALYNISDPTTAVAGNQLGLFESLLSYYDQNDLNDYFKTIATNIPVGTHPTCHGIDGGICEVGVEEIYEIEALLDLQVAYPLIYPQQIVYFDTDDQVYQDSFLYPYYGFLNNFFDGIDGSYCTYSAFGETGNSPIDPPYPHNVTGGYNHSLQCGVYKPTNVISISYSSVEAAPEIPLAYQKRQCNEILKLGLQGVSVVTSSGDEGVGGYCIGSYYDGAFAVDFPQSCPYITTVGATQLPAGAIPGKDKETASVLFPSGGGFSNIWTAPSYQKAAVNHFLNDYPPPYPFYTTSNNESVWENYGRYNHDGRGYPDVSANGVNYLIFAVEEAIGGSGTSVSAPLFASILTRINEERLAAGKSTVGFVNPTLYSHPHAFHDITVGDNPGCETDGFSAEPGWDPVTGLGTPNYYKLLEIFMSLP